MSTLTFEPLIPASLWVTLAVAAAVLLAWYARTRPAAIRAGRWIAILTLMAGSVAAVLTVLLNPTWVRPLPPPAGKPLLTLMVDATDSMATTDAGRAGDKPDTRFRAAGRAATELAGELADRFEVRLRTFSDVVTPADAATFAGVPNGRPTDLTAAMTAALETDRPQGQAVVLFSDGIHNAPGGIAPVLAAARLAKSMAAPVYTRTIGGDAGGFDLGLQIRSPQELAFRGQTANMIAVVSHPGLATGKAEVVLSHDGREVERKTVTFSVAAPAEVRFEVRQEEPGLYPYDLRVVPLAGELTEANNGAAFQLRVVDEPIHILLVEGKPYWDAKFLTRTLSADAAVELQTAVKVAPGRLLVRTIPRPATQPATMPAAVVAASQPVEKWRIDRSPAEVLGSAEAIKPYQVIVLGRDAEEFLGEAAVANLRNWIARDGGSLVCYRGSPVAQVNQGLARLLPVRWTPVRESRFRLKFTEQGENLQWLAGAGGEGLELMPTLATVGQVDRSKPLAVVLATAVGPGAADAAPAVSYQPYGSGRVVVIEGAGMWRWAFLAPQQQEQAGAQGGDVYGALWHNLLRWLASNTGLLPGQKIALRGDKVSFATGESVSATLLVRSEGGPAVPPSVELDEAKPGSPTSGPASRPVVPRAFAPTPSGDDAGSYRILFGKLPEGRYAARIAGASNGGSGGRILFDVRSFGEEQLDLKARPDLMARIADESGGAVLAAGAAGDLARRLTEDLKRSRPDRVERITAWDTPWVLAGILALWTATWALRRSSGLV